MTFSILIWKVILERTNTFSINQLGLSWIKALQASASKLSFTSRKSKIYTFSFIFMFSMRTSTNSRNCSLKSILTQITNVSVSSLARFTVLNVTSLAISFFVHWLIFWANTFSICIESGTAINTFVAS